MKVIYDVTKGLFHEHSKVAAFNRIHDNGQHDPLEFTPDDTPDEARAWLARQRYEHDQASRVEAKPTSRRERRAKEKAMIRAMSDIELARQSQHLRAQQSLAQSRADWVEREMRRRARMAR